MAVLSQGSNNTFSQPMLQSPTPSHENQPEVQNPPLPHHVASPAVNSLPLPQHVGSQNVNNPPLLQHVSSQNVSNPASSQKQTQDEGHQPQPAQASLKNSPTVGIQNLVKDPVPNIEVTKKQAPVNEQPRGQIICQEKVPFGMLLPILLPQLAKDRAMQLKTLYCKLKKDEITKDSFVLLMKGIVGDQMLRMALSKVQSQRQRRPNQGPRWK
ncbi:hypothetical protein PIB30_068737 [Stylosanthes scabra]|uniref:RST domain-containing protein n=1 Tax=Stylosanthes scabra TaxID=79078 RepID=A0ABU6QP49_9FABA|nr:hypothetical protein [Stylosanthes scabra]